MPYPIFNLIDPCVEKAKQRRNIIIISLIAIVNRALWSHTPQFMFDTTSTSVAKFCITFVLAKGGTITSGVLGMITLYLAFNYFVEVYDEIKKEIHPKYKKKIKQLEQTRNAELEEFRHGRHPEYDEYNPYIDGPQDHDDEIILAYHHQILPIKNIIKKDLLIIQKLYFYRQKLNLFLPLILATYAVIISSRNIFYLFRESWPF